MAYVSKHKFAKITARKVRLLTDLIRNKPVGEALDLLKFNKKRGAVLVAKVLKTAIANADAKEADVENLHVSASFADDGPIMKRMMQKDRGKSYSIFKRTCHITVEVDEGAPKMTKAKRAKLELRRDRIALKKKKEANLAANAKKTKPASEGSTETSAAETK